ncbi:guanine nucleotide-binding protein G(o) subunit alpha-like isoform X2 [Watersipora subatra]|uniref:guanine nucleotide-binding protein G(o) subunit alpha-like isoform X2 n=1 Tax=Watersipora subatra TaxID=2589382 RepID=UPI00355BE877
MGACLTLDDEEKKARIRSEHLDKYLQQCAKDNENIVKILLLGAGESGKSTLVKQMKIIHNDGFTSAELQSFKITILQNLVGSMRYVLNGMGLLKINLEYATNRVHAQSVLACAECYDSRECMLPHLSVALHSLWADRGVRLAVSRGFEYELNDSATYYFENMTRICSPRFCPTAVDVLRARVRTSGVIETCFRINHMIFRMFDVGGQRSERKKWIQFFDDAKAVLYVVALSGYDMYLHEDTTVKRLDESLRLFSSICNNRFFLLTSMEKILQSGRHLRYYYKDFAGADRDVESAAMYIQSLFMAQNRQPSKVIYPHFTTATNTSNIKVVFDVLVDTILKENLSSKQCIL